MSRKILFVCTGNTCRSPMAEGIFNAMAAGEGLDAYAVSCGISASGSSGPSKYAVSAALRHGADISAHEARPVSDEILSGSDDIYCMTDCHARLLKSLFPQYSDKISRFTAKDIPDPYGGGPEDYSAAADEIKKAVAEIVKELKGRSQ